MRCTTPQAILAVLTWQRAPYVDGTLASGEEETMDIEIQWQEPIQLTRNWTIVIDENNLPKEIQDRAGVYFFSRKHGKTYLPFYIGETENLRQRLKGHLNWSKFTDVLKGVDERTTKIKQGQRYFHYGYFIPKKAQQKKKCIRIVQKHLVREAMARNLPLLNLKLTAFKTDTLNFVGTKKSKAIYTKTSKVEA
jgi:hypothetical protein